VDHIVRKQGNGHSGDGCSSQSSGGSRMAVVLPLFTQKQKSKMMGEKDERLEQFQHSIARNTQYNSLK
jgi:hypothetical protein